MFYSILHVLHGVIDNNMTTVYTHPSRQQSRLTHQTMITFTIRKEIECVNDTLCSWYIESLSELYDKKNTFGEIKIPEFTYGRSDHTIWYVSDYVKGTMLSESDMRSIVWNECVLREDMFSLLNYDRTSYIRCSNTSEIYYIDLNDCGREDVDARMKRFWNTKSRMYK